MTIDLPTLAEFAGLAVLAAVGHVGSLIVGIIDGSGRRDRPYGVMVLFILLCSPVFFDNRPHDLPMMMFAFAGYLVAISIMEKNIATSPVLKKILSFAIGASLVMTLAALVYLCFHLPIVSSPGDYALTLLSRNVVLFLLLSRGACFAFRQKNLRGYLLCYVLLVVGSPFLTDFALIVCGPLLALGCWALGGDIRRVRARLTL